MLEVRNCSKRFGGVKALENVSFKIEKGEIVGIIGPNGAGKTTLFNVISGLYPPENGRIFFEGLDITGKPPYKITKLGIARTFQNTILFPNLTVLGNLLVTLSGFRFQRIFNAIKSTQINEIIEKAYKILELLELTDFAFKPINMISLEARKRLSIGLAIATNPKLLLLDEPTAGLNFEETLKILQIIRKLKDSGITIAIIEHKMRFIKEISDRILVLDRGKLIAEGGPDEIFKNEEVIKAYLGDIYATT